MACMMVGPASAAEDGSCESVCHDHPARVKRLFAALNLDHPGLEHVRTAATQEDWPAACRALVAYYRDGRTADWLRVPPVKPGTARHQGGDAILDDTFTFQSVTAKQPRLKNGRLNWAHAGPRSDMEWAWFLNRHQWFGTLLAAWRRTGNPDYARGFDRFVRDWVTSNPQPARANSSAQWRPLEVGLRLIYWPTFFYGFQRADAFTPAGRILMLSSVPEHAEYVRQNPGGGNKLLMNMRGLAMAGASWPEFKNASPWFDYAIQRITPEMNRQVHPDGVHNEMSSSYHWVGIHNLDPIIDLARRAGRPLPAFYREGAERMYDYAAYSLRPNGRNPLNSDSDLRDCRRPILAAAERYQREDWRYIVTNGREGTRPPDPPSRVWPVSGQMVMRDGWDTAAQWAYFDAGPHGGWHGHHDKLHLSVTAGGRDLLVDGGRYWYKGDVWRGYFVSSASHNVILVDGAGQVGARGSRLEKSHVIRPEFDFVKADYTNGFGKSIRDVIHTRAVVYLRGTGWIVADHVSVTQPRTIQALWHFHPDCTVEADGLTVASADEDKGNMRIVPAAGPEWRLDLVKGRTKPTIQGWYSPTYNVKAANTAVVYSAKIETSTAFAWVLFPAQGAVPEIGVRALDAPAGAVRLKLTLPDQRPVEIAVRLTGGAPIPLSNGLTLDGDCAILGLGEKPLVAGGRVTDHGGKSLTQHAYSK